MKNTRRDFLKLAGISTLALPFVAAGCGFPEDPQLDDQYTRNVYPGATNTYVLGSSLLAYLEGHFTTIYTDQILTSAGNYYWDDLRTPVNAIKIPTTNPPSWENYKGGQILSFENQAVLGNEELVYFTLQMPHDYVEGTNIYPHIHWTPENADGGDVRWLLTYSWANIEGSFPAESSAYMISAAGATIDKHLVHGWSGLDGTSKKISSMLVCKLQRNSSNALDTYTGAAYLLEFDVHYMKNSPGSRTEGVK